MHPNSAFTHRLSQSSEIPVQLLLANSQYLLLFFLIKCFPYSRLDFDYTESSGVPEHLHILKTFERVCKNVSLSFFVGISSFCKNAVCFFNGESVFSPVFVIISEVGNYIVKSDSSFAVRICKDCFYKNRL